MGPGGRTITEVKCDWTIVRVRARRSDAAQDAPMVYVSRFFLWSDAI